MKMYQLYIGAHLQVVPLCGRWKYTKKTNFILTDFVAFIEVLFYAFFIL